MILTLSDREEHIFNKVVAALNDESVLEVTYGSHLSVLTFPGLEIHIKEQTVYHNDTLIPRTHREFFTLTYLASHPFWVFSKEQIYEAVWKEHGTNCGSAVTNVVSQIRRKIGDGYIETVVGSGYRFVG